MLLIVQFSNWRRSVYTRVKLRSYSQQSMRFAGIGLLQYVVEF